MASPPARSQAGATAPRADGAPIAAPTPSGIADVDALLWFNGWRDGVLSFSFPTAADQYADYTSTGAEFPTFSPLSLEFREAVRQILGGGALEGGAASFSYGSIASFTNLGFSEVAGGGGTMRFANSEIPGTAYAYLPFSASGEGGDTWFNAAYMNARAAPVPGTYTWLTTMHEIGHALGLIHAHEGNGLTSTAVSTAFDSIEFTVMSYRGYVGQPLTGYRAETGGYAQTFMMLDIRALQQIYGADFTANATDTTYTWNPTTGEMSLNGAGVGTPYANRVFLTVWDGGGVDTYDLSDYSTGATIDLTPGGYSLFSAVQRANLGDGNYARGNVFNALQYNGDDRSLIENAIGTSGDDTIIGNHVANVLDGGAGADTLTGGLGADRLAGGLGDDTYHVDNLGDVVTEARGQGADTVFSSVSFNAQTRGAAVETIVLTGTARTAVGDVFANTLVGNASQNVLDGYKGADTMEGRGGNDLYTVDNIGDVVVEAAGGGIDTVRSAISYDLSEVDNVENLFLLGGADIDATGNDGLNTIRGAAGDNVITGRGGIDVLHGGAGADRFVYESASDSTYGAYDRIRDLKAEDIIDLRAVDADTGSAGDQAFALVDDFSGQAGEMTLTYVAASRYTVLAGDVNGDGVADMRIVLTGNHETFAGIWW